MNDMVSIILAVLGTGGVLTCVVVHRLTLNREARDRKHAFRGSLGQWLGMIKRDSDVAKEYSDYLPHLSGFRGQLYRDFFCRRRFTSLCDDLGSLKSEDIQKDTEHYRGIIGRKIEVLIDFV